MSDTIKYLLVSGISFALGYFISHLARDERYTIRRTENKPYLVDKLTDKSALINDNLQLGTIEERIKLLLSNENLPEILDKIEKEIRSDKK